MGGGGGGGKMTYIGEYGKMSCRPVSQDLVDRLFPQFLRTI